MSGGTSTLWRTSLCGVVMALSVFATGCAMEAGDADEDTGVGTAEVISMPAPLGGLKQPKSPVTGHGSKVTVQAKSPTSKIDEVVEPEPEPWHPDTRGGSDDPDDAVLRTTPDRSDDHK
ncbi:MAG: hypothetical protein ABJE95_12340 [Byssovorax sp.]